jgi:hypothetical protein
MALKFSSTGTTDEWSLGEFRVNARKDGLRWLDYQNHL